MDCNQIPHPGADELSAYVEGGLARAQRRVLEAHLGVCGDCRRLAACAGLLLRQSEPPRTHKRLAWEAPLAVAATAVLAAALWWRPAPSAPPTEAAAVAAPAPRVRMTSRLNLTPVSKPRLRPVRPVPTAPPAQLWPGGETTPAPTLIAASLAPAPPAAPARLSPRLGFSEQATPAAALATLAAWNGATPALPPALDLLPAPILLASTSTMAPAALALPWPLASGFTTAAPAAPPHTAGGPGLSVPVLSAALETAMARNLARADALLDAALRGSGFAAPHPARIHVRVVVITGTREWAGGRADQLFTSADGGLHWRRVRLPDVPAAPPLLRSIVFVDAQHGLVSARNGQRWASSDGGRTWTVQAAPGPR